ncbi:MAG: leucine-rich repeat domain-containing protein [Bacteroidaceae bacterium]|nr:leucine-rich repeat domain-containing protein [Bacteroidaceae bacterium]
MITHGYAGDPFFVILLLCMEASLYAQTFETDNFLYRINPDGSASWLGMTTIGSESKGFYWQEGKKPIVTVNGRPDDTKFAYHKIKKVFKIPESIKHNGKRYPVTSIDVEDNYFFRCLDEQKMDGPMPWLCHMSIQIPASIKEVPERMWALHYEGLQVIFKEPQNRYVEEDHCMMDREKNRVVAIDFYSMPLQQLIARDIVLPSSAQSLSPFAMRGHIVSSIKWPASITEIESETFRNCIFQNDLTIPSHIKVIGASAFEDTSGLGNLQIEEGVEIIGERAFYNSVMTTLTIPRSCHTIGYGAFAECHSLKQIKMSDHLEVIPECAFLHTYALDSIVIPKSVRLIGPSAFQGSRILSISLPQALETIEPNTFAGCQALGKVKLPQHLQEIGSQAFKDCINLSFLDIPASCEVIGESAFSGSGIQILIMTDPQITLKTGSLSDMRNLKLIHLRGNITTQHTMPLIHAIFQEHPVVCVNLEQPILPFQENLENSEYKKRIINQAWQITNSFTPYKYADVDEVAFSNKRVLDKLVLRIFDAALLCWCNEGTWKPCAFDINFKLNKEGRLILSSDGTDREKKIMLEAYEHQLCGLRRLRLNTGTNSLSPQAISHGELHRTWGTRY